MEKYTEKASIYKKSKPSYSAELYDYLYSTVGFTNSSVIADIGAGTGIFCHPILERGGTVYAVEPNGEMLDIAKADLSEYLNFIPINTIAEATGLNDASVDFITAAESFHLCDKELFKKESKRILRPGGKSVLIWNTHAAFTWGGGHNEIALKYNKIFRKNHIDLKLANAKDFESYFKNGVYKKAVFCNDLILDKNTFVDMHLANSYAPSEEHSVLYHDFCEDFNNFFDEFQENGQIFLPTSTYAYIGEIQ